MESVLYKVQRFDGDYVHLISSDGVENKVALALLPIDIFEGDSLLYENFSYTKQ